MKKISLSILVFGAAMIFSASAINAQMKKGDKQINIGIGLAGLGAYASAEIGIADNIGVGPIVGYNRYSYGGLLTGYTGSGYGYGQIRAGLRGSYHLGNVLNMSDGKFDPYVAASAGLLFDRGNYFYNYNTNNVDYKNRILPFLNPRVGANMELTNSLRGYADLGYGGSWLQAGIILKL
jgi:hypothetical protein